MTRLCTNDCNGTLVGLENWLQWWCDYDDHFWIHCTSSLLAIGLCCSKIDVTLTLLFMLMKLFLPVLPYPCCYDTATIQNQLIAVTHNPEECDW